MAEAGSLARFVQAQEGIYPQALAELRAGSKHSHWMWFIFPQIAGLGRSPTAQLFAVTDRAEAKTYSRDALLGNRLIECTQAMLAWAGRRSAPTILGPLDALKFKSSMTLFEACADDPAPFAAALDAFHGGERDGATLVRLRAR
jgi:uncharacterized protein (DUF1810 family)